MIPKLTVTYGGGLVVSTVMDAVADAALLSVPTVQVRNPFVLTMLP